MSNRHTFWLLAATLCLSLAFSSCKKNKITKSINTDSPSLGQLDTTRQRIDVPIQKFDLLSAKAKFEFNDGYNEAKARINVRIKKDSLIWVSINASVGIEVLRAKILKDSIFLMDRDKKTLFALDFATLSEQYNFKITFDLLQSMLIGEMIRKEYDYALSDKEYYFIRQNDGRVRIDNFITKQNMQLAKVLLAENNSPSKLELIYQDFFRVEDNLFPRKSLTTLDYARPQGLLRAQVAIEYSDITLNDPKTSFPFSVPRSYEIKNRLN
jgi:hypothetical protein